MGLVEDAVSRAWRVYLKLDAYGQRYFAKALGYVAAPNEDQMRTRFKILAGRGVLDGFIRRMEDEV